MTVDKNRRDRWGSAARPQPLYRRGWVQGGAALLLASTALGFNAAQHTSRVARAADLRAYYQIATADLSSCSGGLRDALTAMQAVVTGANRDVVTATQIVTDAQQACTPVANTKLYDLASTQPPPTLARLGLQGAAADLSRWAYPQAATALIEVRTIVRSRQAGVVTAAFRRLQQELAELHRTAALAERTFAAAGADLQITLPSLTLDAQSQLPGTQQS